MSSVDSVSANQLAQLARQHVVLSKEDIDSCIDEVAQHLGGLAAARIRSAMTRDPLFAAVVERTTYAMASLLALAKTLQSHQDIQALAALLTDIDFKVNSGLAGLYAKAMLQADRAALDGAFDAPLYQFTSPDELRTRLALVDQLLEAKLASK